jgi:D-alanine-D-alanine ligase
MKRTGLLLVTTAVDSENEWYNFGMARTVVGVLRGGTSNEYGLSLKTGAAMLNALPESSYDLRDILIDKRGLWHMRGMPVEPARALSQVDVVLNGLHGGIGEDGTIGRLLERAGVPYAGSRSRHSALALNKLRARGELLKSHVAVPESVGFNVASGYDTGEMARMVFSVFGPPYIVKPATEGASSGVRLAWTIIELPNVLGDVLDAFGSAIVEEYLMGDEATVGVVEGFRGEEFYVLPPAKVIYPADSPFLHFDHHTQGDVKHMVPSDFSDVEKQALMDAARAAHKALGLSHFSRSDFIVTRRGPQLLEVDALPHLYEGSAFSDKLHAVGSSVREFLEHAIGLARRSQGQEILV